MKQDEIDAATSCLVLLIARSGFEWPFQTNAESIRNIWKTTNFVKNGCFVVLRGPAGGRGCAAAHYDATADPGPEPSGGPEAFRKHGILHVCCSLLVVFMDL